MQNNLRDLQDVLDANLSATQIIFAPQFVLKFVCLYLRGCSFNLVRKSADIHSNIPEWNFYYVGVRSEKEYYI